MFPIFTDKFSKEIQININANSNDAKASLKSNNDLHHFNSMDSTKFTTVSKQKKNSLIQKPFNEQKVFFEIEPQNNKFSHTRAVNRSDEKEINQNQLPCKLENLDSNLENKLLSNNKDNIIVYTNYNYPINKIINSNNFVIFNKIKTSKEGENLLKLVKGPRKSITQRQSNSNLVVNTNSKSFDCEGTNKEETLNTERMENIMEQENELLNSDNKNINSNDADKQEFFTKKQQSINILPKELNVNEDIRNRQSFSDNYYNRLLIQNCKKGDKETVLELLGNSNKLNDNSKCKININFQNEHGWSALHFACDEGNLKIAEILIKSHINLNLQNNDKKTALHFSVSRGYFDITKMLIENGADLNCSDNEQNLPIHLCAIGGYEELFSFILDKEQDLGEEEFTKILKKKNLFGKTLEDLCEKKELKNIIINANNRNCISKYITLNNTLNNNLNDTKNDNYSKDYDLDDYNNNSNFNDTYINNNYVNNKLIKNKNIKCENNKIKKMNQKNISNSKSLKNNLSNNNYNYKSNKINSNINNSNINNSNINNISITPYQNNLILNKTNTNFMKKGKHISNNSFKESHNNPKSIKCTNNSNIFNNSNGSNTANIFQRIKIQQTNKEQIKALLTPITIGNLFNTSQKKKSKRIKENLISQAKKETNNSELIKNIQLNTKLKYYNSNGKSERKNVSPMTGSNIALSINNSLITKKALFSKNSPKKYKNLNNIKNNSISVNNTIKNIDDMIKDSEKSKKDTGLQKEGQNIRLNRGNTNNIANNVYNNINNIINTINNNINNNINNLNKNIKTFKKNSKYTIRPLNKKLKKEANNKTYTDNEKILESFNTNNPTLLNTKNILSNLTINTQPTLLQNDKEDKMVSLNLNKNTNYLINSSSISNDTKKLTKPPNILQNIEIQSIIKIPLKRKMSPTIKRSIKNSSKFFLENSNKNILNTSDPNGTSCRNFSNFLNKTTNCNINNTTFNNNYTDKDNLLNVTDNTNNCINNKCPTPLKNNKYYPVLNLINIKGKKIRNSENLTFSEKLKLKSNEATYAMRNIPLYLPNSQNNAFRPQCQSTKAKDFSLAKSNTLNTKKFLSTKSSKFMNQVNITSKVNENSTISNNINNNKDNLLKTDVKKKKNNFINNNLSSVIKKRSKECDLQNKKSNKNANKKAAKINKAFEDANKLDISQNYKTEDNYGLLHNRNYSNNNDNKLFNKAIDINNNLNNEKSNLLMTEKKQTEDKEMESFNFNFSLEKQAENFVYNYNNLDNPFKNTIINNNPNINKYDDDGDDDEEPAEEDVIVDIDELSDNISIHKLSSKNIKLLDDIKESVDDNNNNNSDKNEKELNKQKMSDLNDKKLSKEDLEPEPKKEEKIGPSSFICLALLGQGSFGEVYLVKKKDCEEYFAMKVLDKEKIARQNIYKYAMTERNVLTIIKSPFVVKLNYAFQTTEKLFLLLDYCPGGDLAKQLQCLKRFPEEKAKFYLCEVANAIGDLHKNDIIFRDLKPDNIVIDRNGHVMLTDFGLSKEGISENVTANSFCGSIAYLAPEMLSRKGHGKPVDWYLLGVVFYEMLVGIPPFFTNNQEQIFRNIERGKLIFPNFVSPEAQELIKCLLRKEPQYRLGSKTDFEEIKNHPYFKNVDWERVYKKLNHPPKIVRTTNFMQFFRRPKEFLDDFGNEDNDLFEKDDDYTKEDEENKQANNDNYIYNNKYQGWSFVKSKDA